MSEYRADAGRLIQNFEELHQWVAQTDGVQLPTDPQVANTARAAWAARALLTHIAVTNNTGEPLGTALADLLADLRHLADVLDLGEDETFEGAWWSAERRYAEEVNGEL